MRKGIQLLGQYDTLLTQFFNWFNQCIDFISLTDCKKELIAKKTQAEHRTHHLLLALYEPLPLRHFSTCSMTVIFVIYSTSSLPPIIKEQIASKYSFSPDYNNNNNTFPMDIQNAIASYVHDDEYCCTLLCCGDGVILNACGKCSNILIAKLLTFYFHITYL